MENDGGSDGVCIRTKLTLMKTLTFGLGNFNLLSAYEIEPIRICKDGWHLFESSCFFVSSIEKTWQEAQVYIKKMQKSLA